MAAWMATARAHPILNPFALFEASREWLGGAPTAAHEPHLTAALDWLARAQDVTLEGGIARGYSLTWNPYFRRRGWQAPYPETTGYIVPTLYAAARHLRRPAWAEGATALVRCVG